MSFSNAEIFMFFVGVVAYGYWMGQRVREYVEKRKYQTQNSEVYWQAQKALVSKHCEQLARAEMHGVNLKPIKARQDKEFRELDALYTYQPKN